jgi:tRNA A-37 threonylcarbamoyl transferase component Bud32
MNKISDEEFDKLARNAEVLMSDNYGVKVLQTPDRKIIKLYRLKNRFSSALLYPYALRFLRNALALKKRGIATVDVESAYSVPGIKRDIVIYQRLAGTVLREALKAGDRESRKVLLEHFAAFVAELHDKGIFFRSIHFGNILVLPDGIFALIDIGDMRFNFIKGLSLWHRLRNFRHMCRYPEDVKALADFEAIFLDAYLHASKAGPCARRFLTKSLNRYIQRMRSSGTSG